MAELASLGLTLLTMLLEGFTNWTEKKEQKNREEHVADVRADPAAHWLRKFGGKDKRTTSPGSTNAGGCDNE